MKAIITAAALMSLLGNCNQLLAVGFRRCRGGSEVRVRLPQLRAELLERSKRDQEVRNRLLDTLMSTGMSFFDAVASPDDETQVLLDEMRRIDTDNQHWLRQVINRHGWPVRSLVGADASRAAWLISQHAVDAPELQRKCLRLMQAARPGEVSPADTAYLVDRVRLLDGMPQLYGTQLTVLDSKLQLHPVENREALDDRRKAVGLQPITEYLEEARQALHLLPERADADHREPE